MYINVYLYTDIRISVYIHLYTNRYILFGAFVYMYMYILFWASMGNHTALYEESHHSLWGITPLFMGNHTESSPQRSEGRIIIPRSHTQVGRVPGQCFSPLGWHFWWPGAHEGCGFQEEEDDLIRASPSRCQAVRLLLHICYRIWSL